MAIDLTTDTDAVDRTTWYNQPTDPRACDLGQSNHTLPVLTPNPDGPDDPDAWIAFLPTADTTIDSQQFITADLGDICILDDRYR